MKICVASAVFRPEIQISPQIVSAGRVSCLDKFNIDCSVFYLRVPKGKLEEGKIVECVHCGCRGCSG